MRSVPFFLLPVLAVLISSVSAQEDKPADTPKFSFRAMHKAHRTKLLTKPAPATPPVPAKPPKGVFDLVSYTSPAGKLAAYVSPDPGDGKKHPLIIWLTGGFSNSIGEEVWEKPDPSNDQTAAAYRNAGVPMMFPSLRGGNNNPGEREGLFGEVDDVIAAAAYAAALPWVDPSRLYLGGHSTGGTLALLVAGNSDVFRAVISFGPVHTVVGYGQDVLPFDIQKKSEMAVRAPLLFFPEIKSPTFILEGENEGNIESLRLMKKYNKNPKIQLFEIAGGTHFTVLSPFNEMLAKKVLADTGKECAITLSEDEVKKAKAAIVTKKDRKKEKN